MNNATANYPKTVAIYEADLCYGGPEEGGWYYETGERYSGANAITVRNAEQWRAAIRRLEQRIEAEQLNSGRASMFSVLSTGEYVVRTHLGAHAPRCYPEQRPRYE